MLPPHLQFSISLPPLGAAGDSPQSQERGCRTPREQRREEGSGNPDSPAPGWLLWVLLSSCQTGPMSPLSKHRGTPGAPCTETSLAFPAPGSRTQQGPRELGFMSGKSGAGRDGEPRGFQLGAVLGTQNCIFPFHAFPALAEQPIIKLLITSLN